MPSAPGDTEAVLDHLLQRSGVLREPVPGRIDFVHRTVQEYLTAKQFADDGDLEPLISQAHKDQWRETVIMAAGHANAPQRAELLGGLLARAQAEPRHARRLRLLVAGCLETLPAIPAELRGDVEQCLDGLVPPRDLASARSLSNVGEPILDRLPRTPDGLSAAAARAVVRTAWLVNGSGALDLIAGYGGDTRDEVQEELVKGWEYFDPELYATKVLAETPLGGVRLAEARLVPALRHLRRLTSLTLDARTVTDLSFLRGLDQPLSRLTVFDLTSGDLEALSACAASLTGLTATIRAKVEDFTPLHRLRRLKVLTFGAVFDDLDFVEDLPELSSLSLHWLANITDLSPLAAQSALTSLALNECRGLTNVDDVPIARSLKSLSLVSSAVSAGIEGLAERAPGLTTLHLNHSEGVNDIRRLAPLGLTTLGLWGCRGITDFTPLAGMRALDFLDVEDTHIADLTPVGELSRLETLWLRGCENITDLTPLAGLPELRRLYIADIAPGVDLAPLAAHRKVTVYVSARQDVRNGEMLGRRLRVD
jgi:hypothetical protein